MDRWVEPIMGYVKSRYVMVLSSIWIVWISEFLVRGDAASTLLWTLKHGIPFTFNVLTVLGLLLIMSAIIGKTRIAYWIVSSSIILLSLVSGIKLKILGLPLLPWDFTLAGEAQDMVPYVTNIFTLSTISGMVVYLGGSYALQVRIPHSPVQVAGKERAVLAAMSILLLTSLYTDFPPLQKAIGLKNLAYNQADNVASNGFALASLMNAKMVVGKDPDDYDAEAVEAIVQSYRPVIKDGGEQKPNIIVVLSESLWDLTVLDNVTFSKDPLEFYHSLQLHYPSGTMLSPQFGGGTANVEFEVLTGNTMRFLPQGSIVYNQYIDRPIDSLASILSRQGYTAKAISPYHNWYFNSNKVYEYLGFSQYISMEFFNPVYEGPYIADREVANVIISETSKTEGPAFIFANTMQNHFHYYPGKFEQNTIEVEGEMSEESRGLLETYAQGTKGADAMLKQLVDFYSQEEEPTVLVFFGDHLPFLGDDYKTYRDIGYLQKDDPDFLNKMYRVPVLVWNNFLSLEKTNIDLSPSFLGPYVLDMAEVKGSYYTDFLLDLSARIPVIPPKDHYEAMNVSEADLKEYETLQYDILFGEQRGYTDWKNSIMQPGYTLGYGSMTLEPLTSPLVIGDTLPATEAEARITVQGGHFAPQSIIYVNGQRQPTQWKSWDQLTFQPASDLYKAGTWELQVRILDSKETVIAESNTVTAVVSSSS
ncbi:LTA synthase family protein [Paenibacillus sp. J2TS4]|uniref:LTA synthase family protein n=1 Tax=Paenibacillus sp. J2TS4 TaxID=2807194 RepID=UPI001B04B350|nr:LTA synthase family protein [Paenibacillus sp. J2TS4]GIP35243.1 sulfatase [Paenibacillus sp. J2TS4]